MEDIERLTRRWERERRARKEAESLLEEKSRKLFEMNEELVQLAAKLTEKEEWSRSILEAVVNGIVIVDEQGMIQFYNRSAAAMFDCTDEKIVGQSIEKLFICQANAPHAIEALLHGITHPQGKAYETTGVRKGGTSFPAELKISVTNPGSEQLYIVVVSDISQRKQAEEELAQTTRQVELILETVGEGIFGLDANGSFSFVNKAAELMLGWEQQQLIGVNSHQLIHHTRKDGMHHLREECPIYRTFRSGQEQLMQEDIFWCRDGTSIPVEYFSRPIQENGGIVGVVVSFRDITERIIAEERRQMMEVQLRQAQKLEAVGQLASGIAHEINTPTQFVNDNTHFLQEAFADYGRLMKAYDKLAEETADAAASQARLADVKLVAEEIDIAYLQEEVPLAIKQSLDGLDRIAKIVRAMKEFSHPGSADKNLTDLNHAIQTTLDVSRNEWKYIAELVTDLDPQLPQVPVLPGEFNQVMLNLIVNAAHAINDVVGEKQLQGIIRISTREVGDYVEVKVGDNGAGISETIKDRIFEPFFTTKDVGKGSGQGLAIAWSVIVDKHSGSMEVESKEGVGTTFTICLPKSQAVAG